MTTSQTLDKVYESKTTSTKMSKVVHTALKLIENFQTENNRKLQSVEKVKNLLLDVSLAETPTRSNQLQSFYATQLIEVYSTLIQVPDYALKAYGLDDQVAFVLSKYLELKIDDGGFNDIMTEGFNGFKQQAAWGDFYVLCDYKKEGDVGMPQFKGTAMGSLYWNKSASQIRGKTMGNSAYRFGIMFNFDVNEVDDYFPGMMDNATAGDIPNVTNLDNPTDEKTDTQEALDSKEQNIQVFMFYDILHKVHSIIGGSNAYEYKTIKGDDYPFALDMDGEIQKKVLPVAGLKMFSTPEGIFNTGVCEIAYKMAVNEGAINSSLVNNIKDNNNAPGILNIENAAAGDLFQQLNLANKEKEKGENVFIVPALDEDAKKAGKSLGQQSIGYLKNDPIIDENERLLARFDLILRRLGFNMDFNYSDPNKTLGQTELDIENANASISKFQAENKSFYEFIALFTKDAIIKFGDENDETIFGEDIKLNIGGEEKTVSENRQELFDAGLISTNKPLTVGEIVKMFKTIKNIEIEINVKNGVKHNKFLERSKLTRLLNALPEGSPAQMKTLRDFASLEGDKTMREEDFAPPQQEGGMTGSKPKLSVEPQLQ